MGDMGIPSQPSGRGFIRDSHAVFRSWVHVHYADKWGLDMTKEQYNKAKVTMELLERIDLDIKEMKYVQKLCTHLTAGDQYGKPWTIPASQERINDFLEIVMQDLVTKKAKLEKELEDL